MAAFRTLSLALGIGALASISAFGQGFTCTGKVSKALDVRGGGITEALPTITQTCSIDQPQGPTQTVTEDITVDFGEAVLAVTNNILASGNLDQVKLNVVSRLTGTTDYAGEWSSENPTQITFANVVLPNDDLYSFQIKLIGVRVAVPEVTASTPVAGPVFTDAKEYFVFGDVAVVANIQPTFTVATTKCDGTTPLITPKGVQTCATAKDSDVLFGVQLTEKAAGTFKTQANEGALANNPTRITLTFKNIPANATLFVSDSAIAATKGVTVALDQDVIDAPVPGGTANCGGSAYLDASGNPKTISMVGIPASSKGVVTATYMVMGSSDSKVESFSIGSSLKFTGGMIAASATGSQITVTANFAPQAYDDDPAPYVKGNIPRFQTTAQTTSVAGAQFAACGTTLLFPYVNADGTYETGIAIVNTGKDASGALSGTGTCSVSFFGNDKAPAAPYVTEPLAPGQIATFTVGSKAMGFAGYAIANCSFQYAHGLAYSTSPNGATEYLGLVINSDRDPGTEGDRQ